MHLAHYTTEDQMVKKGQLQVSKADSPKQGQRVDPSAPKIKSRGTGSHSQARARGQKEGSRG